MVDITLAITSCGRMDLLEKTLISFFRYNTYPIKKTIIVDDSGGEFDAERIGKVIPGDVEFIINDHNIGQIKSIDKLYSKVGTKYIFHCEDDWEFYAPGFIEESLAILQYNPKIFTVWLRSHNDTNGHPLTDLTEINSVEPHKLMIRNYRGVWSGFTFNPGLRRLEDYLIVSPYVDQEILLPMKNKNIISEVDLSIKFDQMGFRSAISNRVDGYVRHIGFADHIPQEWERSLINQLLIKLKNFIKRLLVMVR